MALQLRRRQNGKRLTLSFGHYPDLGLAAAREKLAEARAALAEGREPDSAKAKTRRRVATNDNFAHLADEWLAKRKKEGLASATVTKLDWFVDMIRGELGGLTTSLARQTSSLQGRT